ncbi:MAG: hypothetical protein F7C08_00465 [Desulfurococcales archaeon]|nr:hypothetical protein [Desulfurococcales archaeon]MCE4604998.1 hypothetical protein [Desulfurococcales archaeon]
MKRIHISADIMTAEEAGLFLVSALLVSHGVRIDTEAWVRVGDVWLVARGNNIRQLRPDPVSADAWVRAAIYKGRASRLGVKLLKPDHTPPPGPCVGPMGEISVVDMVRARLGGTMVLWYGRDCREAGFQVDELKVWLMPALANVILDRIEAGLPT